MFIPYIVRLLSRFHNFAAFYDFTVFWCDFTTDWGINTIYQGGSHWLQCSWKNISRGPRPCDIFTIFSAAAPWTIYFHIHMANDILLDIYTKINQYPDLFIIITIIVMIIISICGKSINITICIRFCSLMHKLALFWFWVSFNSSWFSTSSLFFLFSSGLSSVSSTSLGLLRGSVVKRLDSSK